MSRREQRYLETLRRRRAFLAERIAGPQQATDWDRHELSALNWIIRLQEEAMEEIWVVQLSAVGRARVLDVMVGPFRDEGRARRYAETVERVAERDELVKHGIRAQPKKLERSSLSASAALAALLGPENRAEVV